MNSPDGSSAARFGVLPVLWAALMLAPVVAVWSVEYLPSQDGPAHVDNANVLLKYGRADLPFARYYQINWEMPPNLLTHWLMAGLLCVASPAAVVKLVASLYLVVFPLSVLYAARGVGKRAGEVALLAIPFGPNLLFAKGFYNFSFGVAGFFLLLGYFLRNREQWNAWRLLALMAISLLLYACHPVALAMGVMAVVVMGGWSFVRERRVKRLVLPMLALAPALGLYAVFHWRNRNGGAIEYASLAERLKFLVTLNVVRSFGGRLEGVAVWLLLLAMVGIISVAVLKRFRGRSSNSNGLVAVLVTSLVVYAIAPDASAGGSYITLRLSLFSFLITVVWVAGSEFPPLMRRGIPVVAAVCTFLLAAAHVRAYRAVDPVLREFCSVADQIRPGSTLLPLIDEGGFSGRVRVLHNATGYLAARRDLVNLRNYEAALNYFPIRYRGGANPEGGLADYVLVCPGDRSGAVDERYVPVYRSETGLVVLYGRRSSGTTSRAR